jgi:hypothetical protein
MTNVTKEPSDAHKKKNPSKRISEITEKLIEKIVDTVNEL